MTKKTAKLSAKKDYSLIHRLSLLLLLWPGLIIPVFAVYDLVSIASYEAAKTTSAAPLPDELISAALWSATTGLVLYIVARQLNHK